MQTIRFLFLSLAIFVFLVLAFKNPFGDRSLIGNFDPFPDSLHYVVPARNFAMGQGFNFSREGGQITIGVPPVYSWSLIPSYLLNSDARSFYFTNLVLGIISIIFLYKICWKLTKSVWATGLLLFLYVTTFIVYWQPSLAMAENALLPAMFAAIWLSLQPLTNKNIIMVIALAVACYGSKYVALPVTASLILFTLGRIWNNYHKNKNELLKKSLLVFASSTIALSMMSGSRLLFYFNQLWQSGVNDNVIARQETSWLSLSNIGQSLSKYSFALFGLPIYNLWYVKPILPMGLSAVALLWCLYSLVKKNKYSYVAVLSLMLIASQISFLSLISMIEGRYAFTFIPAIFTAAAAALGWCTQKLAKKIPTTNLTLIQIFVVGVTAFGILLFNFNDLKTQLLVNYKGAETPWWQVGIISGDKVFSERQQRENMRTIVISSLPPFVWDFYKQADYLISPLSANQSMINEKIWDASFIPSNLTNFYKEQAKAGASIYLSTVGFGNKDWPILEEYKAVGFDLELIMEDCMQACKVYELKLSE